LKFKTTIRDYAFDGAFGGELDSELAKVGAGLGLEISRSIWYAGLMDAGIIMIVSIRLREQYTIVRLASMIGWKG